MKAAAALIGGSASSSSSNSATGIGIGGITTTNPMTATAGAAAGSTNPTALGLELEDANGHAPATGDGGGGHSLHNDGGFADVNNNNSSMERVLSMKEASLIHAACQEHKRHLTANVRVLLKPQERIPQQLLVRKTVTMNPINSVSLASLN